MKLIVWCIILTCVITAGASAQTSDNETLRALLAEVRQLRAVVEVFAAAVPQAHITVQKLQLQQQRVAQLSDQLSELRRQIDELARQQSEGTRQLEEERGWLKKDMDAAHRADIEKQIEHTKLSLERSTLLEQQLRVREAELNTSLSRDQAKVNELEQQLARLERSLAAVGGQ
jgi:chromosome segregation ATPase